MKDTMETYLTINLGTNSYLIRVKDIVTTLNINANKITTPPNTNDNYIGVIENSKEIIPLMDIRPFLSIDVDKEEEQYKLKKTGTYANILKLNNKKYGIIIDGFGDFIEINPINFNNNIFKTMVIDDNMFIALNMEKIINTIII